MHQSSVVDLRLNVDIVMSVADANSRPGFNAEHDLRRVRRFQGEGTAKRGDG